MEKIALKNFASLRSARPLTSVLRWLLVVVGCAVLATAQPMSAASEPTENSSPPPASSSAPKEKPADDQVIYPRNSAERQGEAPSGKTSDSSRTLIMLVALALAAAGAWVLIQRRQSSPLAARGQRKLQIDETRPLGNRQYLVVANYDGKKFLLGVTPGQINLLTPLDETRGVSGEEQRS